jgi:chorismate mutase
LWAAVKARQERTRKKLRARAGAALGGLRRRRYLFSSLTRCGECGAGFITLARNRLGCFGASARGTCTNRLTIRRDEVEQRVLKALRENLLRKDLFDDFCREFTREMNRLRIEHRAGRTAAKRELQHLEVRRAKIVQSIMEGVPGREVKDELIAIGARRDELARQLEAAGQAPPLLHPSMADLYRQKVTSLATSLEHPDSRPEATETLRGLIDVIVLTPVDGALRIELKGNLAAMLGAAQSLKTDELSTQPGSVAGAGQATPRRRRGGCGREEFKSCPLTPEKTKGLTASPSALQIALVAGAGFEPATFGL